MFQERPFFISFILFVFLTVVLYSFIIVFNRTVPLQAYNYRYNSHHYFVDPRIQGEKFDFLIGLGQWDAQWYLRIADSGYPTRQLYEQHSDPHYMGGLSYAFFPLYPIVLFLCNLIFSDITIAAFFVTAFLLIP